MRARNERRCARRGHPLALLQTTADGVTTAWCTCGRVIEGDPMLAGLPPRIQRRIERLRAERQV